MKYYFPWIISTFFELTPIFFIIFIAAFAQVNSVFYTQHCEVASMDSIYSQTMKLTQYFSISFSTL